MGFAMDLVEADLVPASSQPDYDSDLRGMVETVRKEADLVLASGLLH